jgi:hypothetical protein
VSSAAWLAILLTTLFHFFVPGMFPARIAEFLRLKPFRVFLPVLGGRVVPVFAVVALQ